MHKWVIVVWFAMGSVGSLHMTSRDCVQAKIDSTYKDKATWTRMSIMATAGSGLFSSDRTIQQ